MINKFFGTFFKRKGRNFGITTDLSNRLEILQLEERVTPASSLALPKSLVAEGCVAPNPQGVVFVDSSLLNAVPQKEFADNLVVPIYSNQNPLDQISESLKGLRDVSSVRIISHGSDGELWFGNQKVGISELNSHQQQVAGWSESLAGGADILLYGCSVASTGFGKSFVNTLARYTGADVAASTNSTGLGGDTLLEYQVGMVTGKLQASQRDYENLATTLEATTRNSYISSWTNRQDGTAAVTMTFDLTGQFYYAGGYLSDYGYVYMYLNGNEVASQYMSVGNGKTISAIMPLQVGDNEISVSARRGFPTYYSDPTPKIITIQAPYYLMAQTSYTVPVGQTLYTIGNVFGTGPITQTITNLPAGVTMSSSGVILGNPTPGSAGVYNSVLTATNGFATATLPLTITVTNQAPSFIGTSPAVISGATEGAPFTITHAMLTNALDETDPNGDPISFRIESVLGGTLTKNGVAVTGGSTLVGPNESLVWTPPPTVNGTLNAFTVKAYDGALYSATSKTVQVAVGAVNDPPTFTQFSGSLVTGNEDTTIAITFADLLAKGNEADIDGTVNAFVIKSVTTGTLRIGSSEQTATLWNASTNKAVTATLNAYWTPDTNANGPQSAFTAVARDDGGLESATPVQAVVTVNAVNDSPTLTSVAIISGATGSSPFEINYSTLASAANAADVDGDPISFRIETVSTGTVEKWNGSAWVAVVAGSTMVSSGEKIRWTPVSGSSGLRNAFTIKAWDGQLASTTAIQVRVDGDRWRLLPWTDDVSSGIAPEYRYTHAYNFGATGNNTLNGVGFTGIGGANPSVANKLSTTGFGNVSNNDANNLGSSSRNVANDSISTSSSSASLTLSGLVPGGRYVLSMFTVGLENGTRMATLSSAMGQILVNQDEYGNNNGERIDYQYLADAAGSVTINFLNVGSSFHLHGLANREYSPSTLLYAPSNFTYDAAPKSYQASASASNLPFISAGTLHSVILKSDGTVSAFGTNESGQTNVPANLSGVVAVSAGGYHSLALKSDGTVVAWGNNYSGQSNIPAGLNNVVSISAGGSHNLALKSDGTVVAWGSNGYNQCNVPAGLTGVVAISAGDNHSMALKSDGTVVAWGYYFYDHSTPPAGLTDVVAISAGFLHSLALKSDGTVVAWGNNGSFQSQVPAGLRGVVAISAGSGHSIALKADGTVVAWGDRDNYGSINIPAGLSGVVAIDAGSEHNIALKSDGTVVTFGWTRFGQQYISNPTGALVQVASGVNHGLGLKADGTVVGWGANYQGQLNIPSGLNGVVAVQAGNNFSVALKSDGTVVAWGYNNFGQCNVPAGLTGVVKIAATDTHVLALKSNGTVVAWGEDYYGMATVPANLSGVIAIATGPNHSLALKSDGTVVAWGYYNYVPSGLTNVKAISSGKNFNVVLKNDGTVEAWGSNDHGQTTLPSGLTGVLAIDCGYDHTVALKSDGSVVSWGYNPWGETTVPNSTQGVGVSSVVAGTSNSYALKSDGTVVGWGLDAFSSSVPTVGLPGRVNPILNTFTYVYEGRNSTVYTASSTPPTNAGDYKVSVTGNASGNITTISQNFTITRFTPSVYYYTQVNSITYGAALTSQQVNSLPVNWWRQGSIVNIPGSVIYSPAIGAVLNVGSHTLQLTFLPTDSVNFNPALATSVITVNKATVASANISITAPANLTFDGNPKSFSATSSGVAGFTYSYSGRAGTTYGPSPVAPTYAGNYTVTANVNDPNYQGSKSLDFAIAKAVPTITSNPSASSLIFGQTIASSVLSGGAANVPGTFAFDYTATQPSAGSSPQTIVFTPTDTVNYQTATGTIFVTVSPLAIAAGAFTFSTPNLLYNGSPKNHSATAAGPWGTLYGMTYSYVGVGGTVYAQSATAPTNAGSYAVTATLTGSNFAGSATKTFTIEKATPSITWANPAAITYGTAISSTQLNATTGVAGSFAYTPALGTVLAAGARTLQAVFTPTDAANYNPVTTTVPLQVNTTSLPITLVSPPGLTYDGIAKNYFVSQSGYISAGSSHVLVLKADGTVVAWGRNQYGQTNVPGDLVGVIQVSAGAYHSVAVQSNGTLKGWGDNSYYQITGRPISFNPTVYPISQITTAKAAAAGGNMTVVLLANGTVTVLGDNLYESVATVPAGLSGVTAVAAGWSHAVALKSDGTVVAWGNNSYGQTNVPAGLSGVVAISACGNHTLALKSDGTVLAWGNNSQGQATVPAGLSGVVGITTGWDTSYATKFDGTVVGWGHAYAKVVPSNVTGVVALVQGDQHAVALKTDGSIVSWGRISNNAGTDLIDASTLVPNPLTGVGNFSYSYSYSGRGNTTYPASSTAPTNAGSYTLAVTSTDPNYSGGKTVDFVIAKATPTITTLPQSSIIAEGQALSVAVLDGGLASIPGVFTFSTPAFVPSAGTTVQSITFTPTDSVNYENVTTSINVLAQGAQATVPTILSVPTATPITFGQRLQLSTLLGGSASVLGTFVYSSRLTVPNPGTASQSVTFIPNDIATYAAVTFAVPLTVYDGITSPVSVPLIPPPSFVYDGVAKPFQISRSQFLSSGRDHTLILNSDGTVTAIGSNSMGECNVPAGLTGVVAVSAALGSSMALKSDGTVVEWGYLIGAAPSGLSGVVAISRADHTLALKSDGTVVAWGYNGTGQCNVPSGLSNVVAVAAGYGASFALKSDGTVVGWGDNGYGQLNIPAGLSGVIALDVGIYGSVAALKSDGTVVSWGRNSTFGGVVTGQTAVPVGLGNVVAISEGVNHAVALKSDGTIVAWGLDTVFSDTNSNNINLVPPGISGVVAVAAGTDRTFVMKADGSVVWWGHLGATAPYMVNGQPYQTAQGYGIAVPAPNGVSGVSAGFAFTSTYTGREGTTYSASSTAPTNPGNYSVTVTGTAAAFSSSKTINFTISKATPTVSALPTASAINYGQTLASSSLSGGAINFGGASISGSFSFVDGTIAPSAGNNIQNVFFTPVNSSLFNSVMVSIPVQVNKVTPVLVNAPVASTITFGQTLANSTLGDGIASVPGSFGFTNGSNAPNAGNASQAVTFTPTDTSNYNSFTTAINVLVAKANPSVTAVPTASSINYGQTLSSSILGGGVASVPGAFAFVDSAIVPSVGTTNQNIVFTPTDTANYNPVVVSGTIIARSFATANDSGVAGESGGIANAAQGFNAVGNVISNDANYAGNNLAVSAISNSGGSGSIGVALTGAYGSLIIQSNGDYVYTVANSNSIVEALQINGTLSDSFNYALSDGVFTETGVLVVTINGANDAPSFSSLTGGSTKQGVEDTEVVITFADVHGLANSSDLDGTVTSYVITSIESGTLRIGTSSSSALPWDGTNNVIEAGKNAYWVPALNANGLLSAFKVVACDNSGAVSGSPVAMEVQIQAVNDAPVAAGQVIVATEDILYSGNLSATDVENSVLTYSIGISPAKGVVTITDANTGAFTFVPASNATGSDSFTFKVNDGLVDSGYVTVNITINQVNDPPVGNPQSVTTNEDTTYTGTLSGSDVENSVLTFSLVTMPSKGVVILNDVQTGAFTYVPNVNANGSDSFTFKVNDGSADSVPVVVNLQILPVNDAPVLANFGVTGLEDTTISLNLADFTNAFSDPENDSLASIKILSLPSAGTLKLSGNNVSLNQLIPSNQIDNLAYDPVLNENGTRQFTVAAYDGVSFSEAATISLIVVPSNDIPTLSAINALTGATEDTPFEITYSVLSAASNATDVEDSSLSFRVASVTNGILESWDGSQWVPASNTTVLAVNQKLRWTPSPNANGTLDAFTVVALDSGGLESATPVLVRVTTAAVNDVPVANAQSITPTEDTTYTGTLTGSDVEASALTYVVVTQAGKGTVTITNASTGAFTYAPNQDATGVDSFTFKVNDGTVDSAVATISVNITPVNDVPVANAQSITPTEDTTYTGTLTGSDIENSALTYRIVSQGSKGVVTITNASTGAFTYSPNLNATGADSFTFIVNDGSLDSAPATISVNITAVNDTPIANAQSISPTEDTTYTGTLTGSDIENSALTYTIVTQPTKGSVTITNASTGEFTYTPNLNATGADSFTFKVNDGTVDSAAATISVNITPVNDAPVANAQSITPTEDTTYTGTLTGSDIENGALTYSVVSQGSKGVVTITNAATGAFTYAPNQNATGADSFTFKVNDGTVDSTAATISVNITPVNDVPVANAQSITPTEDTTYTGTLTGSDVEGSALTYMVVTQGSKGVVTITNASTGSFTYVPNQDATGADSFTFKVNDGTVDSAAATISVNITPVNDAPVANAQSITPTEDTTYTGTLTGSDIENGALTYSVVSQGGKGTVTITNASTGAFTYTPNQDATGADSFTFKVNDGTMDSAAATISVNITATQDAPVVQSIATVIYTNTNATDVFANHTGTILATDPDAGAVLVYGISGQNVTVSNGMATLASQYGTLVVHTSTGAYTYTPNQNELDHLAGNSTDDFQFTVTDGIDTVTTVFQVSLVDHEAPMVSLTSSVAEVGINQTAAITFVFSEIPVGFTAGSIAVTNGAISSLQVTGNPKIYNAVFTPATGVNGMASITVQGTYADAAGNAGASTSLNPAIEVHTLQVPLLPTSRAPSGSTGGSTVPLINPETGEVTGSAVPFVGFTGEVRTTSGDIDGDGRIETIAAAGAGGGPAIVVMDPQTGEITQSFFAFDPNFKGGVYVTLSDVNHDGVLDIIAGAGAGGGPHVKIFNGSGGTVLRSFFAYSDQFRGGVSVASVDINQDGILDLVTGAGPGGGPHVKVYDGASGGMISEWFAYPIEFRGGVYVAAGDIGNDGIIEVVTGAGSGGAPVVAVWNPFTAAMLGQFQAYEPGFTGGVRVGVSDGNLDGVLDLVTGAGPGGAPLVKGYSFPQLDLLFSFFSGDPDNRDGVFLS